MDELIRKSDAIKAVDSVYIDGRCLSENDMGINYACETIDALISDIPTVDAMPIKEDGKWIRKSDVIDAFKTAMATSRWSGKSMVLKILDALPAIERKRGEWIELPSNFRNGKHICSNCLKPAYGVYHNPSVKELLSDFCPNCGASMKGADNE